MVTTVVIDKERALELLTQVVDAEGPEFIYWPSKREEGGTSCKYVKGNEPDCGVGRALALAGVPIKTLIQADNRDLGSGVNALHRTGWLEEHGVSLTPGAARVFVGFQVMQDAKTPWGESLDYARSRVSKDDK